MKRLLVVCFMFLAPHAASADETERLSLARQLIDMTQADTIAKQFYEAMAPQIMGLALSHNPGMSDAQKQRIVEIMGEESDMIIPPIVDATALIYADTFSAAELSDIIAFYRTPTGKKVIAKLPDISAQGFAIGQAIGQAKGPEMGKRIVERLKGEQLI